MPIITKNCARCDKEFSGPRFHMKKRTFCSHECYVENRTQDLAGQRFGRLVVSEYVGEKRWKSVCDCGGVAVSKTQNLTSGKTQSCGCLQRERSADMQRTHGNANTRAHNVWSNIIQRCTNPNFKQFHDYGGRGITVCDEWRDFANFLHDMGQPPAGFTIERVNNSLGYSKENCRWATRKEQQRNRRANHIIEFNGERKCLTDWAQAYGMHPGALNNRLRAGWSIKEALGIEPRKTPARERYVRSDARWITFNGKTMFLAEWCRELGLNPKTVQSRIARGASDLKALGLE